MPPTTRTIVPAALVVAAAAVLITQPVPVQAEGLAEEPVLRPNSNFEPRPWGYVREDFTAPSTDKTPIFVMDGYEGANEKAPTHYVRMRDGALMAVHVGPLKGNVDATGAPELAQVLGDEYVIVKASIRGTGCSEGRFDLFDRTHARDGRELIEWTADRPYTREEVGMWGASYSGLTAFHVASTQPPSLEAMSANMVIGDLYRGIVYPGGVLNQVFPAGWTYGFRPAAEEAGLQQALATGDEICAQNQAHRRTAPPTDEPIWGYFRRTDDTWWHVRSLLTYADDIEVPTYISQAWQDEQTGPRGGVELFRAIHPDPVPEDADGEAAEPNPAEEPKYLTTTNGVHLTAAGVALDDAEAFFDHYMLGEETGIDDRSPVVHHVQTTAADEDGEGFVESAGTFGQDTFPDPETTTWNRFYLDEGGTLDEGLPPTQESASDAYATGSPRKSWLFQDPDAGRPVTSTNAPPDVLTFRSEPAQQKRVVAGPMTANLFVETTTTDFDVFVQVSDVGPDGNVTPLQRGLLKASHRGLDEAKTLYNEDGEVVRPYHPHTNPTQVQPGKVNEYHVEIFNLVHVLQPGHRLQVQIGTPPLTDGIWGYDALRQAGVNQVHRDSAHPSNVIVPFAEWTGDGPIPDGAPCGQPQGYRCIQPGPAS